MAAEGQAEDVSVLSLNESCELDQCLVHVTYELLTEEATAGCQQQKSLKRHVGSMVLIARQLQFTYMMTEKWK